MKFVNSELKRPAGCYYIIIYTVNAHRCHVIHRTSDYTGTYCSVQTLDTTVSTGIVRSSVNNVAAMCIYCIYYYIVAPRWSLQFTVHELHGSIGQLRRPGRNTDLVTAETESRPNVVDAITAVTET